MVLVLSGTILALAWLLRRPAKLLGLPIVIGEMLAGFLLGPTGLGNLAPHAFTRLFSSVNTQQIGTFAELIITAYYFVIGLEFDSRHFSGRHGSPIWTALASAFLPAAAGFFVAGTMAAKIGLTVPAYFQFAVALCFSVTVFPVLLRILEESGLSGHPIGTLSMGSTALIEILVWACLPVVLAVAKAGSLSRAGTIVACMTVFLVTWVTLVRRGVQWLWTRIPSEGPVSLLLPILIGIGSAYITSHLGIRANFGALLGGFVLPREIAGRLAGRIKPVCVFFLPIFFAATGLKTRLELSGTDEILTLLILVSLAYGVKLLSTTLVAKLTGNLTWNDATTVGHLMCAKGAIGFAILEICSSSGVLEPKGFPILAFVVLTNTLMSARGVFLQRGWARNHEVRRGLVLAGER